MPDVTTREKLSRALEATHEWEESDLSYPPNLEELASALRVASSFATALAYELKLENETKTSAGRLPA